MFTLLCHIRVVFKDSLSLLLGQFKVEKTNSEPRQ